ncbi:MAG: hypothetical protein COA44_06085 [Arcobacter sp.]|nr:MAG: hypothetical protein COA44_06085 [Arcobacter sp.]
MSVFSDINDLHDSDSVAFNVLIQKAMNKIVKFDDNTFSNTSFEPKELESSEFKIYFGERSIREAMGNGTSRTHVEAALYYVINKSNGHIITDKNILEGCSSSMQSHLDGKYDLKNNRWV